MKIGDREFWKSTNLDLDFDAKGNTFLAKVLVLLFFIIFLFCLFCIFLKGWKI
jgi:hypothetical protein